MSQPLAPRPSEGPAGNPVSTVVQRSKKISTACLACKQRKTKCSGGNPCEACSQRNSPCLYDATSDQRRKIANQKNVQDLQLAQEKLERHQMLLGGMIATLQAGSAADTEELVRQIRSGINLSGLAAHVRNAVRSDPLKQEAYEAIEYVIDGGSDLPSPNQILDEMQTISPGVPEPSPQRYI